MNRRTFLASLFRSVAVAATVTYAPGVLAVVKAEPTAIVRGIRCLPPLADHWACRCRHPDGNRNVLGYHIAGCRDCGVQAPPSPVRPTSVTVWYRREKTITFRYEDLE